MTKIDRLAREMLGVGLEAASLVEPNMPRRTWRRQALASDCPLASPQAQGGEEVKTQIFSADALVRYAKMKRLSLTGREVNTEKVGEWPGGWAVIVGLSPDPAAPEIVFTVRHLTAKNPDSPKELWEIGIFSHELLKIEL